MIQTMKELFANESIKGLFIGILLMTVVFLFVHFVLGIKAFS